MERSFTTLLLLACCLLAPIQLSRTKSDHLNEAQTPRSGGDPESQHKTNAPEATVTVTGDHMNSTQGYSTTAKVVRASDGEVKPSDAIDDRVLNKDGVNGKDEDAEKGRSECNYIQESIKPVTETLSAGVPLSKEGEMNKGTTVDSGAEKEEPKEKERQIVTYIPELPAR